jgi:hypothetical protein
MGSGHRFRGPGMTVKERTPLSRPRNDGCSKDIAMPPRGWSAALRVRARELYERHGCPVAQISRETGIPGSTVRSWARGEKWQRPCPLPAAAEPASPPPARRPAARRRTLSRRIMRLAERHVVEVERRGRRRRDAAVVERWTRYVGGLLKLARAVESIEARAAPRRPGREEDTVDREPSAARTLDAVRADFAQKLVALCENGNARDPA